MLAGELDRGGVAEMRLALLAVALLSVLLQLDGAAGALSALGRGFHGHACANRMTRSDSSFSNLPRH